MTCTEGKAEITDVATAEVLPVTRGSSVLVPAMVEEVSMEGNATLYKAAVPP